MRKQEKKKCKQGRTVLIMFSHLINYPKIQKILLIEKKRKIKNLQTLSNNETVNIRAATT